PRIGSLPMRVLLTNDDGIQATGLNELRRALLEVPGVELAVVAPNANRSATARSITTSRPLEVEEVEFGDGTTGFAADGTPVNCPAGEVAGARATRLGRRIYRDKLELHDERDDGRRTYRIYGDDPSYHQEPGTDFAAIADHRIAVTPLHFDLTAADALEELGG